MRTTRASVFLGACMLLLTALACKQSPVRSSDMLTFKDEPEEMQDMGDEGTGNSFAVGLSYRELKEETTTASLDSSLPSSTAVSYCLIEDTENRQLKWIACSSQKAKGFSFDTISSNGNELFLIRDAADEQRCLSLEKDALALISCQTAQRSAWSMENIGDKQIQLVLQSTGSRRCLGHDQMQVKLIDCNGGSKQSQLVLTVE